MFGGKIQLIIITTQIVKHISSAANPQERTAAVEYAPSPVSQIYQIVSPQ